MKVGELMGSDFALLESFSDQNDKDECDITEASDCELCEDVLTAENGVTVRCAVHTLQLSVHDFFKANSTAKKVVSKVRNAARKTHQRISGSSSTTTNLFLDWIVRSVGVQRF